MTGNSDPSVLRIRDLTVQAETPGGRVTLVNGLSLDVPRGAITALVGESGCGKSMTALAVMKLLPPRVMISSGEIALSGERIDSLSEDKYLSIRGRKISMIFQEPMTSLNPLHSIGDQIAEVYRVHFADSRRQARAKAVEMLKDVKIPDAATRAEQYPHQMSGGMRQRVMIAMALAASPELLLADEPTTALDVTIQAQILDLLRELSMEKTGPAARCGILLITHDMGVVAETASNMVVMYSGHDVESGSVNDIFAAPAHPYTEGLLAAIPHLARAGDRSDRGDRGDRLKAIPGQVPRPGERPDGCAFEPRCSYRIPRCAASPIPLFDRGRVKARCILDSRDWKHL